MPRYFFDIVDGPSFTEDTVGVDLAGEEVARVEATRTLSEIAAQELPGNGPERLIEIAVRQQGGGVLFTVQLRFTTTEGETGNAKDGDAAGK